MRSVFPACTAAMFASALMACAASPSPDEGSTTQHSEGWNRLAGNRLAGNRLAGNRLAGNRLAGNRLAGNSLTSTSFEALTETSEILSKPEGRDVYSYIVSCALPADVSIEADVEGAADTAPPNTPYYCSNEHCIFPGGLGVAPRWLEHKLDKRGQGWVSACLFSRVNHHDTAESISLRGRNDGLAVTEDEAALYDVEEGAFFGNFFIDDPDPSVPPDWNACRGEGQASGEFGGLALRDCAEENPDKPGFTYCGFNYAGDCADYTPAFPSPYACAGYDAGQGTYHDCHGEAGDGRWPSSPKYRQVITVWVTSE